MNAFAVIGDAAHLGVTLRQWNGRIVARPRNLLTPALVESIRSSEAAILDALAHAIAPPTTACWNCRGARFFARPERLRWICARCHPPVTPTEMVWCDVAKEVCDG